jgi:hypothetical protein
MDRLHHGPIFIRWFYSVFTGYLRRRRAHGATLQHEIMPFTQGTITSSIPTGYPAPTARSAASIRIGRLAQ